jgi:hypothetical protein
VARRTSFGIAILWTTLACIVLITMSITNSAAQGNQTEARQTIEAIVGPRLTLTALNVAAQTATGSLIETATENYFLTATTFARTTTFTPTSSPSPTQTPTFYTETPINATDEFQTVMAEVDRRLTQRSDLEFEQTGTAAFQKTVDAILQATLGFTATPDLRAASPDPDDIGRFFTQTVQAAATAALNSTLMALSNAAQTATAVVIHATLIAGFGPITAVSAPSVQEIHVVPGHPGGATSAVFSKDGQILISSGRDNTIRLWDMTTGLPVNILQGFTDRLSVDISPDGRLLAASSSDDTIRLFDMRTGIELAVIKGHEDDVLAVRFSPDGQLLASASTDGTVRLWTSTGNPVRTLEGHKQPVYAVAFSPDGLRLASAGQDRQVLFWETASGLQLATLKDNQRIFSVAFSPDGNLLASAGDARTITLWNVNTGENLGALQGHLDVINSVTFSTDGTCLASGSSDNSVILWDVFTKQQVAQLLGHIGPITAVSFSADGVRLLSASADQTIRVWGIRTGTP